MNVKVENAEKNVVQLEIEVDSDKFEQGMQKSYLKNAKKFNIPGFRKGKAPRSIVERYYGEQVLYEDAFNAICPEAYDEAVEEYDIHPVDKPQIDIKDIGAGKNLVFTAKVTVKPDVEPGVYTGVEINKVEYFVTDEDVEKELKNAAEKNARLVTIEDRGIQQGDTAVIDFEGSIDGVPFEGGKGTDHNLVIGSGQFIPGFEEQLTGALTGEEREVNVTFPEDYHQAELAGKQAVFNVNIKGIKLKELPVIDDEFAKDVSEFDTLDAYKESLREKLLENAELKAKHEMEDALLDKIVSSAVVDIPSVMVEKQISYIISDFEMRMRYQGFTIDKYLEIMGQDMNAFRASFNERAEKEVKTQLVLEKIGKIENITPAEDEINDEIAKLAENYKQNIEEFKKHLRDDDIEYIRRDITVRKTVEFLVNSAVLI